MFQGARVHARHARASVELRQRQKARPGGRHRPPGRTPSPVRRQPPPNLAQSDAEDPPLRAAEEEVHDGPGQAGVG